MLECHMNNKQSKPLLDVALGKTPSRTPVWFLRQAGRYLPEYRELRSKHSFLEVCKNADLAKEVTLQPLRRFDLDAAIIFSDILIPCVAMGQELTFDGGHGPQLSNRIRTADDLLALRLPHAERDLGFVGDAIAATKACLRNDQTMIGFAGAPFTVASYMIEGKGSKDFTEVKRLLYSDRTLFINILKKLEQVTFDYLRMQCIAGADVIMLFDTWVGQTTAFCYQDVILPVMKRLISSLREIPVPVIYYPGQGIDKILELSGLNCNVIAVDWRTRLTHADQALKSAKMTCAIQGNIDPQAFLGTTKFVEETTMRILVEMETLSRGHVFNVGHGLLPHTPIEGLQSCIDTVRAFDSHRTKK